jgi:hypothetical protein
MDETEQRQQAEPIPDDLYRRLTASQVFTLQRIRSFGYELQFVRREGLPEAIPFVASPNVSTVGVLEADGSVNHRHPHTIRPPDAKPDKS